MTDNLREFELFLEEYGEKTVPEAMRDFRDAVALEALVGVVNLTDVDTGRARGNWQTTVGVPAAGERAVTDQSGRGEEGLQVVDVVEEGAQVIDSATDPFDPIWLHNGVFYVVYLNDGTESITARHMVEQTAERLRSQFGRSA